MSRCLHIVDDTSALYTLDPVTASTRLVGAVGITSVTDIAFHGPTLYGVSFSQLVRLNPVAFDSNDVLYGALNSSGSVVLARIDRTTGTATVIGPTGLPTVYGLGFFCCRLYAATSAGELADINAASGKATVIGKNTLSQWGMAVRPCCGC